MGSLEQDPEFLREEWTLYGIGVVVILLRFFARIRTVGFRGFQGDDYMSILTLAMFTMDAATVHIIYYTGTNVEASVVQKTRPLTSEEIAMYTYGSKEQLAAWYSYTALIWTMKFTMLFFFHRLTVGLWQHKYVKCLGGACAVAYIAVVCTLTFGCFPTQRNWQVVPDPGLKCTLKMQNFLVTVVLNVVTDAAILAVPVPLLWKLKIPNYRKLVIAALLCSGLFVITAAIIRVVLTLGSNPSALNINRWGVRETIVGIVTINMPILKPLFSKSFWTTGSFKSSSYLHGTARNIQERSNKGPYELSSKAGGKRFWSGDWDVEAGDVKIRSKSEESLDRMQSMGNDSQELIIQRLKGITVHETYPVKSEDVETGDGLGWESNANQVSIHAKRTEESRRQT
ncbi:uncharacterized protein LY89DRAFT_385616 [Mollisia scopiformis]|uniref:Rhodopsin domain-containing protein n=1 Tax=Mollisia scopiformis TaxID=149040 RepID=A0A194XNT7_MOLSC|nr:uncharacterized protein LY89DRAFT_385616 [Mollisia scopiformis]KUJ21838.1 hypothetical protein LY89DRAFT_385616 [Mollisia scopiformis]